MPDLWMPGATRLDTGDHSPTDGGPAKAIAHITWDRNATAARPMDLVPYETLVEYFGRNPDGRRAAPHILWDPFTGRFTQFLPATSRSKSLADQAGGTRTNRAGSVVLQVETVFFPYCRVGGRVFARLVDTPCVGWDRLNAWVRSWGVPDRWPMGRPVSFVPNRSESVWRSQAGWYAHAHVPENDHQDPGSWPEFARATVPAPPPEPSVPAAPRKVGEVSVESQDLKSGFDPVVTLFNVVDPPASISVGCDMGDMRVRVDVFTNSGGWQPAMFWDVYAAQNLAFSDLPEDTRKIAIKRVPRFEGDDAVAVPARATLRYKPVVA